MRILDGQILYSATDLVRFADCRHHIALDLIDLKTPLTRTENSAEAALLAAKGDAHERAYLQHLHDERGNVVEIPREQSLSRNVAATLSAMRQGAEVIYQAAVRDGDFAGHVDFLVRCDRPSKLGNYSYEVVDTKLARSERAKFLIQIGLYSDLLGPTLGETPERMHIRLGNGEQISYRVADYIHYLRMLRSDFLKFTSKPADTYPDPCTYCSLCQWRGLCEERREKDDHLSGVAGILRSQIKKLTSAGIDTVAKLAAHPPGKPVPKLAGESLEKIRRQAAQQLDGRKAGKPTYTFQGAAEGKGFLRLPPASEGDVYFDFEGDPLHEDGLEYLFGVGYVEKGKPQFMPLWAHNRQEERDAFDRFMRWLAARLTKQPDLHIYHYASYEVTALKRLMSLHGLHEATMDRLLREGRFIDLYKVVREGLIVSEPAYSLKNVEKFFMPPRDGEVADAGASIVYYEQWRETGEQKLLDSIEAYNRFDVESTRQLVHWLRRIQPATATPNPAQAREIVAGEPSAKILAHEARLAAATAVLQRRLEASTTDEDRHLWQLAMDLLDFHRRTEKPAWWAFFDRGECEVEQLLDDMECIACCEAMPSEETRKIFPDLAGTGYRYPDQEFKLKPGDSVHDTSSLRPLGPILAVSTEHRAVLLKEKRRDGPLPRKAHLGAGGPLNSSSLKAALAQFAHALAGDPNPYRAVEDLLRRRAPRFCSRPAGQTVVQPGSWKLEHLLDSVLDLDDSTLFIQGPPGCGKTYTASRLIAGLLQRGKTVGVASNSHKAIHNLLAAVEDAADEIGLELRGCKKSSQGRDGTEFEGRYISNGGDLKPHEAGAHLPLVAGTVYFYAAYPDAKEQELTAHQCQPLDYLFIDEAGQVSLANAVIMGMRARNIILVGDQMQLGQPIQGVHPGHSGESTLDYLLDGHATVPPEKGVLLEETWRMHPDVCRFISQAVYDGRLRSYPSLANQALLLSAGADPRLKPAGLVHVPVVHQGCGQRSDEEGRVIADLYRSLLGQQFRDKDGKVSGMSARNILVVAPYNAQVNRLKDLLPQDARVGTVDKFQGQEAEVVMVSMTTSSAEHLPRNIEFLFSRNRLNVAISRARCVSIVVCSPDLLRIPCSTPDQMALVNTLAWFVSEAC